MTLDGMRGVAAMIVVLRHVALSSIAPFELQPRFGYLAVDLFFALSGFVLAHSYDRKFAAGMTPLAFMRARLLRLYPLFAIGLLLGVGLRLFPAVRDSTHTGGAMSGDEVAISALFNGLMLPAPDGEHSHFLFPTNLAGWSLFYEVWFANLGLALFWRRLQGRGLAIFIGAMAVAMMASVAVFHTIDVGYDWRTVAGGFARVGLSFSIGLALARYHLRRPPRLQAPSWVVLGLVVAALFVPLNGVASHIYEILCAFILFPALIYWGAEATEKHPSIGTALGDASYAAYALHVPLLSAVILLAPQAVARPSELHGLVFLGVVFAVSLMLARFVDEPFRAAVQRALSPHARPAPILRGRATR